MASPSSLVFGTGTSHSHQPAIKHPSFVSDLHPFPTAILSMSKPSACQGAPPFKVLSQMVCVSNPQFSETPTAWPTLIMWGGGGGLAEQ